VSSDTDDSHNGDLPRAISPLINDPDSPSDTPAAFITPAVFTTSNSRQRQGNSSRKKTRTNTEESSSVVALTNAVELFVRSQCERDRAGTEVSNVEVQATEAIRAIEARATKSIQVAEEARAMKATRVAEEVRVLRLDMVMRMERLETMLSVLVN